jgi:CBS domain-containing protein
MYARDIMTNRVITVAPDTPLKDIAKLLIDHRISAVPVIDEEKIAGHCQRRRPGPPGAGRP